MQITSVLTLVLGLFGSSAFATIALGNTREGQSGNSSLMNLAPQFQWKRFLTFEQYLVMWYYGQSACTAVNNPGNCGSAVTLNNGAKCKSTIAYRFEAICLLHLLFVSYKTFLLWDSNICVILQSPLKAAAARYTCLTATETSIARVHLVSLPPTAAFWWRIPAVKYQSRSFEWLVRVMFELDKICSWTSFWVHCTHIFMCRL
jgi:hypothetical protein